MRTTIACLLVSMTALGSSCTSSPEDNSPPEVKELNTARAHFATPPRPSYTFTWKQTCFCGTDSLRPMKVTVTNGAVAEAVFVDDQKPVSAAVRAEIKTVDGVFTLIRQAIDQGYDEVDVQYDPQMGYPRTVSLISSRSAADAGMSLTLSEFTVAGGTPTGGGAGDPTPGGW
jgi:hypothetical protein